LVLRHHAVLQVGDQRAEQGSIQLIQSGHSRSPDEKCTRILRLVGQTPTRGVRCRTKPDSGNAAAVDTVGNGGRRGIAAEGPSNWLAGLGAALRMRNGVDPTRHPRERDAAEAELRRQAGTFLESLVENL